jgi:hypothetical protein
LVSVNTPLNFTTGGTTAFAAARAACCAEREIAEQINRSQTLSSNFARNITILLFFYDAEGSRERTYLATGITRLYLGYRKGEGKDDKAYEGIRAGQAGKFDGARSGQLTRKFL